MPSQTNTFEKSNQDSFSHKTVCIIGAGVAGLVSAKVLKRDGFEVTVFEKESAIGGVWAEPRSYPELRSNNPRETYAFSDFDYPESADEFPTAGQFAGTAGFSFIGTSCLRRSNGWVLWVMLHQVTIH
jgi:cation diffusion facilitator CzcD-associated flavoprotein CzcO